MASFPNFYADFTFSGETSSQCINPLNGLEAFSSLEFNPHEVVPIINPTLYDDLYGSFQSDVSTPPPTLLPERFGISDMTAPVFDNNVGACGNYANIFDNTQYYHNINGDECNVVFSPELKPFFSPASSGDRCWGTEGGKQVPAIEETNTKIGRYSVEERKDKILRYLKKKNQRNFNKTIKYVCRKTLADRRVRIRGRFARNNETCEEQSPSKTHNTTDKEEERYSGDDYLLQMDHDDHWLQEAISDMIYYPSEPYVVGDNHEKTWNF